MNFDFNDEQYQFRESIRDSLTAEFPLEQWRDGAEPVAAEQELWPKMAEMGIFALMLPEDQGGLGLNMVDLALIAEELGAALVPLTVTDTIAASHVIAKFGLEGREELIEKAAAGELRIACAVYEGDGGFDPAGFDAQLSSDGDALKLSGKKLLVAGADRADLLLVVARNQAGSPCLALVDAGSTGIARGSHKSLDITGDYSSVTFDNVALSSGDLIGGDNGEEAARYLVDMLTTIAALELAGIGARLLDITVEYVKERSQFGQPIGAFQAIKHRCADMAVDVNSARSGAYFASWAIASADRAERERAVSIAKAKANRMAIHVMREATQLHGGMGYTWEMALHFPYRRGRLLTTLFGSTAFHNERVLAASLRQMEEA